MRYNLILSFLLTVLSLSSCSDDRDRFASFPPKFSAIQITDLEGNKTTPKKGIPFVATVIEKQPGKLLNKVRYHWSANRNEAWEHRFRPEEIYSPQFTQPSDTILVSESGLFTLSFTATYNVSGQARNRNLEGTLEDGTSASYIFSALKISVTLNKEIFVE